MAEEQRGGGGAGEAGGAGGGLDEEEKLQLLKGAAFLTVAASAGLVAGFGSTLALVKKRSPDWFNKGVLSTVAVPESGASLALRALCWGSVFSCGGFALLSFSVWKLLDVHSLPEFRQKMQSLFPKIPKTQTSTPGPEQLDWDSLLKSK